MALSKTWYTTANRALDDVTTALRQGASGLFALKAFLKGEVSGTNGPEGARPGSTFWTCKGSSDGATAGMDDVDRLGATFDPSKWVRAAAGVAHSWIVLQAPGTIQDAPWFLTIDYASTSDAVAAFYITKVLPTGGSITARPTSTIESSYTNQQFSSATLGAGNTHFVTDANGSFHFFSSRNGTGYAQFYFTFQSIVDGRSGDVARAFMYAHQVETTHGAPVLSSVTNFRGLSYTGGNSINTTNGRIGRLFFAGQEFSAAITGTNPHDAKVDMIVGPWLVDTTLTGTIRGRFPDMWMCGFAANAGTVFPIVGNPERVNLGDIVIPCSVIPTF